MKDLNKTVAKFKYKGKDYEIDWLTDAGSPEGYKEYDIFEKRKTGTKIVGHISWVKTIKKILIKLAKEEINQHQ